MLALLVFQLEFARLLIDAAAGNAQAMADGIVAAQVAGTQAVAAMSTAAEPFNPLLTWQRALAAMLPGAAPSLGLATGPHPIEVGVAVRSASGHAMALGIQRPAAQGHDRR